jgi:ABC-type transport system involved in multi-copper enzyme maturation permease subunit
MGNVVTETAAVPSPARPTRGRRERGSSLRDAFAGLSAVGTKELRGRMRGRRAFVILTVYLVLLAAFAWMIELILEQQHARGGGTSAAFSSAAVGQGVFAALMMLEMLLVVALAPAFTAGSISSEREKQTLDMLATTPISSLSIVIAKLFSALTYLFILILASIPLTALVFVFGGVSPDDVLRGYAVLLATAVGLGSVGLFFSALMKRTQAATIATYFGVLFATLGTFFIFFFWSEMSEGRDGRGAGPITGRPPEALLWLNPYFAQADVLCGVEALGGEWCARMAFVAGDEIVEPLPQPVPVPAFPGVEPGFPGVDPARPVDPDSRQDGGGGGIGVDPGFVEVAPDTIGVLEVTRDTFWPKSAIAWIALSVALIVASVQLVTPTRRWRPRLGRHRDQAATGARP